MTVPCDSHTFSECDEAGSSVPVRMSSKSTNWFMQEEKSFSRSPATVLINVCVSKLKQAHLLHNAWKDSCQSVVGDAATCLIGDEESELLCLELL